MMAWSIPTFASFRIDAHLEKLRKNVIFSDFFGEVFVAPKVPHFLSSKRKMPLDSRACTTKELQDILRSFGGIFVFPQNRYNEVFPRVYIGDGQTALDIRTLKSIGITHVLNASEGSETYKGFVNTGASYYSSAGIKYKGFPAYDNLSYDISQHFSDAAEFIDDALRSHGRVLVHCYMGVSRSATLVLAFLMIKRAMTAQEAMKIVRSKREINPNSNFLQQLCNLNGLLISRCKQ